MRKYFPIYEEAIIVIYDFATTPLYISYEENLIFFFISVLYVQCTYFLS